MRLKFVPAILAGKLVIAASRFFKAGYGGTWPGEIALKISPEILPYFFSAIKNNVVVVAGTNGKTTTSLMIANVLKTRGYDVIHNSSGANLENGLVSAFIGAFRFDRQKNKPQIAVLEIDENTLSQVIPDVRPAIVVILNLFRDQLDRYGEVDTIAGKWYRALKKLPSSVTVILNADDPQVAYLGKGLLAKVLYFGISDPSQFQDKLDHATDSIFCLNCHSRLNYSGIYFSHLGIWQCSKCKAKRPPPDISRWPSMLPGFYNRYNTLAAVGVLQKLNIRNQDIKKSLEDFIPAFGRQEEFEYQGRRVKIFLSKNPAGYNQSLRTIAEMKAGHLLLVLNDRIPDGRDISWIWDADLELVKHIKDIAVSGDRAYDLALRCQYAGIEGVAAQQNLARAVSDSISRLPEGETLFILPTYSAMLEVRQILTGRKIL